MGYGRKSLPPVQIEAEKDGLGEECERLQRKGSESTPRTYREMPAITGEFERKHGAGDRATATGRQTLVNHFRASAYRRVGMTDRPVSAYSSSHGNRPRNTAKQMWKARLIAVSALPHEHDQTCRTVLLTYVSTPVEVNVRVEELVGVLGTGHARAAREETAISLAFHICFACRVGCRGCCCTPRTGRSVIRPGPGMRWPEMVTSVCRPVCGRAVSGTVLSFEFGCYGAFLGTYGRVLSLPFTLEAFAFFAEAVFLGLYLYGGSTFSVPIGGPGVPVAIAGQLLDAVHRDPRTRG